MKTPRYKPGDVLLVRSNPRSDVVGKHIIIMNSCGQHYHAKPPYSSADLYEDNLVLPCTAILALYGLEDLKGPTNET